MTMEQHFSSSGLVHVTLLSCILTLVLSNPMPQGMQVAPTADPFGPPPSWGPPPSQNYINPPPPNNNFGPPPPNYNAFPPNFPNSPYYPQNSGFSFSQFQNYAGTGGPQLPPIGPPKQITQADMTGAAPMDPGASSPSVPEQEYEAGEVGNGGSGASQPYNPPSSFGSSAPTYYGPPHVSLLDAYYGGSGGQQPQRNNDIFGGMFGGTPGGNLLGAYMFNEYVF